MTQYKRCRAGDRVEVLWNGEFGIAEQVYSGYSWWQAIVTDTIHHYPACKVTFLGDWDDWDEVVDISRVRWVRCTTDADLNSQIQIGAAIELRCSSDVQPEVWLESVVVQVSVENEYLVRCHTLDTEGGFPVLIPASRSIIRPAQTMATVVLLEPELVVELGNVAETTRPLLTVCTTNNMGCTKSHSKKLQRTSYRKGSMAAPYGRLSEDLEQEILRWLHFSDMISVCQVCQHWKCLGMSDEV